MQTNVAVVVPAPPAAVALVAAAAAAAAAQAAAAAAVAASAAAAAAAAAAAKVLRSGKLKRARPAWGAARLAAAPERQLRTRFMLRETCKLDTRSRR